MLHPPFLVLDRGGTIMFGQSMRIHSLVYLTILALAAPSVRAEGVPAPRTAPASGGQRAEITMTVPLDAVIFIDGKRTYNRGSIRRFVTPPLASGKKYFYDVKVTWIDGERARENSRHLSFEAGQRVTLNYAPPNWTQPIQDLYMDPAAPAPWRSGYYHDMLNAPSYPNSPYIFPGARMLPR
jgi:uncharacterized protein (TIGR03000 family)